MKHKPLELISTSKSRYIIFQISKCPVDCDAMMHDLKYFFSDKTDVTSFQ